MTDTCFEDNEFLGMGTVVTVGNPVILVDNNYGTYMKDVYAFCQFLAEFPDEESVNEPVTDFINSVYNCTQFDAEQCTAVDPPTEPPTSMPSSEPSVSPVSPPSYWEREPTEAPANETAACQSNGKGFVDIAVMILGMLASLNAIGAI